jgi:catechol 2,3-dioxygenase-like lactoylglutathione lyase family enzyme
MKIEHVALQVSDPAAMADWYVKNLGCSVARSGGEPAFVRFLKDGSGRSMLELYCDPRAPVPDYKRQDPLVVHVAFLSDNLTADRDRLVAAGATIAADVVTTPAGDQLLMLRDPWEIPLQLVTRANPMIGAD